MIWFYSDPHFDHKNIIDYCNRPFWSVDEMNNHLLQQYRERVRSGDTVYFLGDMSFGKGSRPARYWLQMLQAIPGVEFHYIKGSHDNGIRPTSEGLSCVEVVNDLVLSVDAHFRSLSQVLLIHDPASVPPEWDGWVIHGHVHNYHPVRWGKRRINVSCDAVGFRPVALPYITGLIFEDDHADSGGED